jgi:redox-sensitive bicupin YhaK (pirin superfamily)
MQHKDSGGHQGDLWPGDVQWMSARAGVIHSEMLHSDIVKHGGVIHGFQIWVNLPAARKMMPPRYQDIHTAHIPESASPDDRVKVRIIAGDALGESALIDTVIPISFLHFTLRPGAQHPQPVNAGHNVIVYVFSGQILAGTSATTVREGRAAIFGDGDSVQLAVAEEADQTAELLLLAGSPLNEPIVRYGPFVMNTHKQIEQAWRDYRDGLLGGASHFLFVNREKESCNTLN